MTGRAGRTRNIFLVWLVWPLITLGIYHLVWWYKINREARDFDENIEVEPTLSLLAILIGWVILIPPFVSVYQTGVRISRMQRDAGLMPSSNGWIGIALSFLLGLHSLYYQAQLNHVWAKYGYPQEGTAVAVDAVQPLARAERAEPHLRYLGPGPDEPVTGPGKPGPGEVEPRPATEPGADRPEPSAGRPERDRGRPEPGTGPGQAASG